MKTIKTHLFFYLIISGFFLLADQWLKSAARSAPDYTYYLWEPWLGWEYYANQGIAFSLPFPNILLLGLLPAAVAGLIFWAVKKREKDPVFYFALFLIIFGAISNLSDRILFSATIDYLRFFTGVVNLADLMVVAGVGILIFKKLKCKN